MDVVSEYHLDRDDRIVHVSAGFAAFATENGGGQMLNDIVGRSIWPYVSGVHTRSLYADMFEQVRAQGREVSLPFRCDSPAVRRFMTLVISPLDHGGLRLMARLDRAEEREPVRLLDPRVPRSGPAIEGCSLCRRMAVPDAGWVSVEQAVTHLRLFDETQMPPITHGVCPACDEEFNQRLARLRSDE